MDFRAVVERETGQRITDLTPLSGGCIAQVYGVRLADGADLVVKIDEDPQPTLDIEGYMLEYLSEHSDLPVPRPLYTSAHMLAMTRLAGESRFSAAAEEHAAMLLAELHSHSAPRFGLERATLIGGLHQPNDWTDSWLPFFAEHRLRYMAGEAVRARRLPDGYLPRIDRLASQLDKWLIEPEQPALIHGDIWTSNVLAVGSQITGFLDPAIYYASPEIELAFISLFGTFGKSFFARYDELAGIPPGFFEERKDLYNLYPLLVHSRLFGGSYVSRVDSILSRYGY